MKVVVAALAALAFTAVPAQAKSVPALSVSSGYVTRCR